MEVAACKMEGIKTEYDLKLDRRFAQLLDMRARHDSGNWKVYQKHSNTFTSYFHPQKRATRSI